MFDYEHRVSIRSYKTQRRILDNLQALLAHSNALREVTVKHKGGESWSIIDDALHDYGFLPILSEEVAIRTYLRDPPSGS